MKLDWPEIDARNIKHADDPQPGDYWHEMFCGICVVLEAGLFSVTVCKTKKDVDADSWTWDLTKTHTMKRRDFSAWLRYDTIPDKTWAIVEPEAHKWAVEERKNK